MTRSSFVDSTGVKIKMHPLTILFLERYEAQGWNMLGYQSSGPIGRKEKNAMKRGNVRMNPTAPWTRLSALTAAHRPDDNRCRTRKNCRHLNSRGMCLFRGSCAGALLGNAYGKTQLVKHSWQGVGDPIWKSHRTPYGGSGSIPCFGVVERWENSQRPAGIAMMKYTGT